MDITIEYMPTHENMDYAFELTIDIVQHLSRRDSLHLITEREPQTLTREEDVFEVKADGETIFNKQALGRLPNGEEVVDYIINNS